MGKFRRGIFAAIGTVLAVSAPVAQAQDFPTKSISLIVPWPPGGVVDTAARIVGDKISATLGRPVIVENRPGAAGKIGTQAVAKAPPDGYTLLVVTSAHATNAALFPSFPIDPVGDFTPVVLATTFPAVLVVSASGPVKTLPELIAHAKANPGKLNYGSAGIGGPAHLMSELLRQSTGTDLVHVPYKGVPDAMLALMSGNLDLLFANLNVSLPQIRAGKVMALGVTSPERAPELPDVPTLQEAGLPGVVDQQWLGFMGPKGMPKDVVDKLNAAINRALEQPEVRATLKDQGMTVAGGQAGRILQVIEGDIAKWKPVVQRAGIKAE